MTKNYPLWIFLLLFVRNLNFPTRCECHVCVWHDIGSFFFIVISGYVFSLGKYVTLLVQCAEKADTDRVTFIQIPTKVRIKSSFHRFLLFFFFCCYCNSFGFVVFYCEHCHRSSYVFNLFSWLTSHLKWYTWKIQWNTCGFCVSISVSVSLFLSIYLSFLLIKISKLLNWINTMGTKVSGFAFARFAGSRSLNVTHSFTLFFPSISLCLFFPLSLSLFLPLSSF